MDTPKKISYRERIKLLEKDLLEKALENNNYNISQTASRIKLPRSTLHRKIKDLKIKIPR